MVILTLDCHCLMLAPAFLGGGHTSADICGVPRLWPAEPGACVDRALRSQPGSGDFCGSSSCSPCRPIRATVAGFRLGTAVSSH